MRPGSIDKKYFYGIRVRVKASDDELTNEIKRIGYIRDRECEMQLRVGDTLILYISTSISWLDTTVFCASTKLFTR